VLTRIVHADSLLHFLVISKFYATWTIMANEFEIVRFRKMGMGRFLAMSVHEWTMASLRL
jgi:hypothetical protein